MLVIFGGVLLLTPGFITDIFGLLFLFPPTRVLLRGLLVRRGALKLMGSMPMTADARPTAASGTRTTSKAPRWTSIPTSWTRRGERGRARRRRVPCASRGTRTPSRSRGRTRRRALRARAGRVGRAGRRRRRRTARSPSPSRGATRWARSPRRARRRRPSSSRRTEEPLERWTLRGTGELSFELTFEALTPPAEYGGRSGVVKTGGMEGYEQLCRVRGTLDGPRGRRARPARALVGQPGLGQDRADARRSARGSRTAPASALSAVRPVKASSHADEALWARRRSTARRR